MKKKITALFLALVLAVTLSISAAAASYTDIPAGSTLRSEIQAATEYGLMNGYNDTTFGYADSMTRAQFVTVLGRMLGWFDLSAATTNRITAAMEIPQTISDSYRIAINAAVEHDAVDTNVAFRPSGAITRAEMSEMLVRALGYKSAAETAAGDSLPFNDVTVGRGYIAVAYEIGMTNGMTATTFAPNATATRAQAAAMLVRIYEKYTHQTDWLHGFYAISSYSQIGLSDQMDAVSAGWSRMTWDGTSATLSTTSANSNEYCIPGGYDSATGYLEGNGTALNLSVYMDTSSGLNDLLASEAGRTQAVEQIINELTVSYKTIGKNPYSGATVDFEGLRSAQKDNFNAFLTELSAKVHTLGKTLYVTVQPVLTTGSYYDGYDYATIGNLADKVILMAHDYDPASLVGFEGTEYYKNAALTPIGQVYESLRAITNPDTGVQDTSKIALAISCKAVAWETDSSGKLLSTTPIQLSYSKVSDRLNQVDTKSGYSSTYANNYATYTTEGGQSYFLWYESEQSVSAKVELARLFGITGVSIWRLGNIPEGTSGNVSLNLSLIHI